MSESTTSGTVLPPSGAAPAASDGAGKPGADRVPTLATGVELLGEMQGSGYQQGQFLVRRADGQTIQLTPLLYRVLEAVDGRRDVEAIAAQVGAATGRQVTADNVRQLIETKLGSLGLLRLADGSEPEGRKANPLLALRFRYVVTDPEVTRRITRPFAVLFAPVLVALLVAAFAAVAWWVLFAKGLASATHEAFATPSLLLLVVAVTVVSAGFHEFGHASACRYGGATPGAMGAGLYLVWPAFYTEVSDSYRLGRAGRVRVDLGGLYFNAIVAVAMYGVWAFTRFDSLLLVVAAQILQMVRQLAPFVRFDGYHVLADLTGVPDLYQRIGPTLKGLWPGNWGKPETKVLKPWARTVVTVWVLVVVPLLLFSLAVMVLAMPRVAATAWASLGRETHEIAAAFGDGDLPAIGVGLLSIVAIALPLLGMAYLLLRLLRRLVAGVRRWAAGSRGRSTIAAVVAAAVIAALAFLWWPDGSTYRPIQAYERGTILDAVPSALTGSTAGSVLRDGQVASVDRSLWASTSEPPTKDDPALALVMVPVSGPGAGSDAAPAWVFPFDRPDAPGEGDNQALAVNTQDGATVYDVAFALVWADDGSVLNANEAYAFASCRDCRTVAVGFQVVLAVGQTNVVVPQNLSGALNYSCVQCVTYALAQQLVVTLPDGLSDDAKARLDKLWTEIASYGAGLRDVPLDEIRADLVGYQEQILQIVADDAAGSSADTDTDTADGSDPAAPTATGTPTGTPTGSASSDPASQPTAGSTATSGGTSAPEATSTNGSTPTPTTSPTASGTASPSPSTTSTGTATAGPTG